MKLFEFLHSRKGNLFIIITSAVLGVALAVCTAFLTLEGMESAKNADDILYLSSDEASSSVLSSTVDSDDSSSVDSQPQSESAPVIAEVGLVMSNPSKKSATVTVPSFTFVGSCDPEKDLKLGDTVIQTDENGAFTHTVELKVGANKFVFSHKGKKYTYTITYRYVIINAYYPSAGFNITSGTTFAATVNARAGSQNVTANFNGVTINLVRSPAGENMAEDEFCDFSGNFILPESGVSGRDLGVITYSATFAGITETFKSGKITCKDPLIAEVIADSAETFNGNTRDNDTRPTNNYLPKGTVDYVTDSFSMYDGGYKNNFLVLQSGRRIYSDMPITPGSSRVQVSKTYVGKLPDHNEISVASVTSDLRRTYLTLDVMWKAPFTLDMKPQSYTNPAKQEYTVSNVTIQYIEINFCYATVFNGSIAFADNPLFSHAEVFVQNGNYTARLHLKKQGAFYGWDSRYNSAGQLVFEFLHPLKATATDTNEYGADLTGMKILVDAGHGGIDPGAAGYNSVKESERNLNLAYKIKAELEKTGATVIMTRTGDATLYSPDRVRAFRNAKVDFCVSVHHDSSTSTFANGFGSYYTTPFSQPAAKLIYNNTINTGLYDGGKRNLIGWHHFYMSRMSFCPTVLTENGYMRGSIDSPLITNETANIQKAQAIVRGITQYFMSVSS